MDAPRIRPPSPGTHGFTLVEVVVAIVVLAVGVLGLGGTTAYIVRQVTLADVMTERSAALQSVVERVQAMDYDSVDAGSDSVGLFRVTWTGADETSQSKLITIITPGPGLQTSDANPFPILARNVPDTFVYRVIRP